MTARILVCDDSAFARKQLARAIQGKVDAEILFAGHGEEALLALATADVDALFLDLTMPVMDGYQVLRALQDQDSDLPVIVVSGDVQEEAYQRVIALGALDFIKKPPFEADLLEALEKTGLPLRAEDAAPAAPAAAAASVDPLDVCREVVNVAMGRAAKILAKVLNAFVILPVPTVNRLEPGELQMALVAAGSGQDDEAAAICQGFIGGGINGEALLMLNQASLEQLSAIMHRPQIGAEARVELLMDLSNILVGACLKGIADQLDLSFRQGSPKVLDSRRQIDALVARSRERNQQTLAFEIPYRLEGCSLRCELLLLFTQKSESALFEKISYLSDN